MMEMDYTFDEDGTIENLVFLGLTGSEKVSTVKEALALLKVSNPLDDYRRQLEAGEAPPMRSDETDTLLKTLCILDELWRIPDKKENRQPSMNVLMLLARALEQLVKNEVRHQQQLHQKIEENQTEIRQWLETAAMLGDPQAQKHYADRLHTGSSGFTQNPEKAAEFMLSAAGQGDAEAQNFMGTYYANGDGVPQDYGKAREWFERAAAQGIDSAYYNLGLLYDEGKGVEQDYRKAHDYYSRAYEIGKNAKAACNLGYLYLEGKGVEKDEKKAFQYYKIASYGGYNPAMRTFADLCERGIGTPEGTSRRKWARYWRWRAELE